MERKTQAKQTISFTTIQGYFLAHWVSTIGLGPTVLYLQLLSYCHEGKDIAWPSIKTLNKRLGTTTKTLIRYRNTLIKFGLIKKVVKQRSSSGGYDHNLYQIILLDKENILYPPAENLPKENEKIISGISEEFPYSNQDNPNKIVPDNKKSLKTERIKEELIKLNLDKKSIDRIILNYSLEDIEEKIDLLQIKRNVINPAGWLVAALKANYLNPESSKEENDEKEKIMETEEMESESKIVKLNKLALKKKEKKEKDKLYMEESLKWIEQNLVQKFEM